MSQPNSGGDDMAAAAAAARALDEQLAAAQAAIAAGEPLSPRSPLDDDDEPAGGAAAAGQIDVYFDDDDALDDDEDVAGAAADYAAERSQFHFGNASQAPSPKSLRRAGLQQPDDEDDDDADAHLADGDEEEGEEERRSLERFRTLQRTAELMADFRMGRDSDEDRSSSEDEDDVEARQKLDNSFELESAAEAARRRAEQEESDARVAEDLAEEQEMQRIRINLQGALDDDDGEQKEINSADITFRSVNSGVPGGGSRMAGGGEGGLGDLDEGWSANPLCSADAFDNDDDDGEFEGLDAAPGSAAAGAQDNSLDAELAANKLVSPRMIARPLPNRQSTLSTKRPPPLQKSKRAAEPGAQAHEVVPAELNANNGVRLIIQDAPSSPIVPAAVASAEVRDSRVFSYHADGGAVDGGAAAAAAEPGETPLASPSAAVPAAADVEGIASPSHAAAVNSGSPHVQLVRMHTLQKGALSDAAAASVGAAPASPGEAASASFQPFKFSVNDSEPPTPASPRIVLSPVGAGLDAIVVRAEGSPMHARVHHARLSSVTNLQGSTVHNPGNVARRAASLSSPRHARRVSLASPAELSQAGDEHRAELAALMTVTEHRVETSFPYSQELRVGRDAYELLPALPEVGLSKRVSTFVEPAIGASSAIKNELVKTVSLSDVVLERSECPTRFSRLPRKRDFPASATLKGLSALIAEVHHPRPHDAFECLVLFNEKHRPLTQEHADLIQALPNLQTLQLQQIKIKAWSRPLKLPYLLNLDARHCGIKELERVQQICLNSPLLYSLTISDNPLCEKFIDPATKKPCLPPPEHPIWKALLLRLPSLEFFNLIPVDNVSRQRAWAACKSKKLYPQVSATLWNQALNSTPSVVALAQSGVGWRRDAVVELNLSSHSLMSMSLFPLRHSLQHLNLSNNYIATLIGSGLHLCTSLRSLNLSNNRLTSTDELYMLASLPLLRSLWLHGNPRLALLPYQQVVIYATRHLRGSNRAPGLQELDGFAISLEQRVAAYAAQAPKGKEQSAAERWRLSLIQQLGHAQLVSIPHLFVTLSMPSRPSLEFADVSSLVGLVSLDLRSNRIKQLVGLEKLNRLRLLDVRYNPELQHKLLIAQVQALGASIEWVSLSHTDEEAQDFAGLRAKFLFALLPHCSKLAVLDHRRILPQEYAKTLRKLKDVGDDSKMMHEYRLHLAMAVGNTPALGRRYDQDGVMPDRPGSDYTLASITQLDLSSCKLGDSFGATLPFLPNLTLLNLSHNKFTSLLPLQLPRFSHLAWLDVRHNKLKSGPSEVGSVLSDLPHLHGFAMAGNPNYNLKYRQRLIAAVPDLASLECELRIIDTYITVDERVAAWSAQVQADSTTGGDGETNSTAMVAVSPKGSLAAAAADASAAMGLPSPSALSDALSQGSGVEGNSSASVIVENPALAQRRERALKKEADNANIRDLALRTLRQEAEAALVSAASARDREGSTAVVLRRGSSSAAPGGAAGSSLMPPGATPRKSSGAGAMSPQSRLLALHGAARIGGGGGALLIDSAMKPKSKKSAAALAAAQHAVEQSIVKFHLVLQENCPPGVESARVKELPLVGLGLSWADFHPFASLQKLLISRNNLTTLAFAGLETLKSLTVLDAHHNRLWDLGEIIGICNELPQLVVINLYKNPFVQFDAGQTVVTEKTSAQLGLQPVTDGSSQNSDPRGSPVSALSPSSARPPLHPSPRASPMPDGRRESITGVLTTHHHSSLLSPEKYRLTFIGHLVQLQSPARCLKFLDHLFVSEDEIIRGLKELGHSAADREMFRFNSIVFGRNGMDPACQRLSLANRKLQRGDFTRFPYLTELDLSKNLYSDDTLLESHLPALQRLTELNVCDNQIRSMRMLAAMVQAMPALRRLRVTGNPGYSAGGGGSKQESDKARRHLLAYFSNVHTTSFRLDFLNSMQISIDERVEALCHAKANWSVMHPPNALDRMRSGNLHSIVAKDVLSPTHHYKEDEERKGGQQPMTPPPNVGNGPNPSPTAAAAASAANPGADIALASSAAGVLASPRGSVSMAASTSAPLSEEEIIRLGGRPLSLEEDIFIQAENARFILTAAQAGIRRDATEFGTRLRKKGLRLLGGMPLGLPSYRNLLVLDLSENNLSDLSNSGLDMLPQLHTLDVRANEFPTLEALIVSLRPCNTLRFLFMQYATRSNDETAAPAAFAPIVFADLRGIERCDEIENVDCIRRNPLLMSAQDLLWKLARIGPNNLRRVDLANKRLPRDLFYPVLSALHALGIQELIANTSGSPHLANEWLAHPQYSDVIILGLGPRFNWLDGVAITDQRRMLAFRVDKVGKESGKITGNLLTWSEHYDQIHTEVDMWLASDEGRRAQALVRRAHHGTGGVIAPGGVAGASAAGGSGAHGSGQSPDAIRRAEGDLDLRLNMPNMQAVNVNMNVGSNASPSVLSNILSKCDIVIHYLQVYGMVLVMDIDIPYPQAFKDWSTWIRLSTLNLEDLWTLDTQYQQEALFGLAMCAPALLVGLYFYFDRLRGRQDDWADSYVTRWNTVKWRTFALYFLAVAASTTLSLCVIDGPESLRRMRDGEQPSPMSLTWALVFFFFFTCWYFVWFRIVRMFQRHWQLDQTELKQQFKAKWLNLIHWAQIIFLFAITSIYMPVARVILIQFACHCEESGGDELCTSRLYSQDSCFPHPITRTQGAALVFCLLYIVLLPLFLIKLIREGIAIVMDLNTVYDNLQRDVQMLKAEISRMKAARRTLPTPSHDATPEQVAEVDARRTAITAKIEDNRKLIAHKRKQQEAEYFGRVNDPIRKLASTSLYSSYEYRWRFWRLLQLAQNLLLVCISLFVPKRIGGISEGRVVLGAIAICGSFSFAAVVRPYYDSWEDAMEIFAGLANTVTVLVAVGLQYKLHWLMVEDRSSTILLVANIAAVVAFCVALVIVPCRIWRNNRKQKKATAESEARMRALNEANARKKKAAAAAFKLKPAPNKQQQGQGQRGQQAPAGASAVAASPVSPSAFPASPSNGNAGANKQQVSIEIARLK